MALTDYDWNWEIGFVFFNEVVKDMTKKMPCLE